MIFKKKFLLLTIFLIIIIQILIYTNNKQKTTFRYFKWTAQEVSIGKLISISFFSGLIISSILNTSIASNKKNNSENIEENFEHLDNEGNIKQDDVMPPQRDIRDAQPTISVNYRVVRNTIENKSKKDKNNTNIPDNNDDWDNDNNDW